MKYNRYFWAFALLVMGAMPAFSQVSNNNEDEVYKIDTQARRKDFVHGQVLVKFKDATPVNVRRAGKKFQSVDKSRVNAVLQEFGVETMEKLLPNENPKRTLRRAKAFNGETIVEKDLSQLYLLELSADKKTQTIPLVDELKKLDEVEFAEPNYKMYLMDAEIADNIVGNPFVTQQWYLDAYGVKQLWNKPIINPQRPVIAILDTGVDMTHPDLEDNLWTNAAEANGEEGYDNDGNGFKNDLHGWDFINNTPNVRDFNMHGTHVAGIAAAANNGIGIIGANPMALIMPISVMQSDGTGDVATIVKGIEYAVKNGADVLNLSLGTYANSRALRQSLERAYQSAVIVAAAGNDNIPCDPECSIFWAPMFPAAYSFVLGVQATTQTGGLAGFSNYDCNGPNYSSTSSLQDLDGFNYELKAPGTNMLSTIPGGKYKALNGTSMSAPLVAGAISALKMVKQYDTQEILWGDLLHTDNIAQAYAVTNRPAELDLMKIMYRERKELSEETEEDYSGDGEIDAGETISLYPVIRTTFGSASNIQMKLEMGDEFEDPNLVEILTPGWVNFGLPLSAYGKGVSLNPMQLRVASNVADNRHIKMKFTAKCDETNTLFVGTFTLIVNNMIKINGLISEDRTLTADHVYLVNDNLGIMEGATLTIEPGTRLEFTEGMGLTSFGKLVADGTPEKPIIFTGHYDEVWAGIKSHSSTGELRSGSDIYTNSDQTIFTLLPTEQTSIKQVTNLWRYFYHKPGESVKNFSLEDYITIPTDMTDQQGLLTDPTYLTPALSKLLADYNDYCSQFPSSPTAQETEYTSSFAGIGYSPWHVYANPRDTISYCIIEKFETGNGIIYYPYMKDCQIHPSNTSNNYFVTWNLDGERINLTDCNGNINHIAIRGDLRMKQSNIINNYWGKAYDGRNYTNYASLNSNNFFNNFTTCIIQGKYYGKMYLLGQERSNPVVDHATNPSYLGSSREDIIRPLVYELGNAPNTYSSTDLSNVPTTPITEAHGIVWKVCVNDKDAQDEYEELAPLGVGKHKFEVYFNRPMNKAVTPQISFGVREPYTQNAVTEDGSWNDEGTIYTAYKTITGKTKSDGVNRIYVYGAEDNEYFECPYEKTRFNVMINAAGSMATGFAAEAGMGRVTLTWNNENNDFDDAMGFNIYRYTIDDDNNADTVRINKEIVDIETTEYTDYDVTPGTTYYYLYKVLSTDLQEYDASNVVAVTPLTATRGDANGDNDVDVQDVITTVNYAAGMDPKPFIFEAADMNTDEAIDILDVIGIIQGILNPSLLTTSVADATAIYTIEDGTLYVESPVALAGVQVQLATKKGQEITVAEDLNGFEHTSTWLSDNDYRFLAYNMSGKTLSAGKHALLHIGNAQITNICLGDVKGHKVIAHGGDGNTTGIDRMGKDVMNVKGVYNLKGQKITGSANQLKDLPKGVYIIDGVKVVK